MQTITTNIASMTSTLYSNTGEYTLKRHFFTLFSVRKDEEGHC